MGFSMAHRKDLGYQVGQLYAGRTSWSRPLADYSQLSKKGSALPVSSPVIVEKTPIEKFQLRLQKHLSYQDRRPNLHVGYFD